MKYFLDIEIIVSVVCNYFKITPEQLFERKREQAVKDMRHIFFYLSCKYTKLPLEKIGREHGNYDHSTVSHSRKVVEHLMATEKPFKHKVMIIEHQLEELRTTEKDEFANLDTLKHIIKRRVSLCSSLNEINSTLTNFITENHGN